MRPENENFVFDCVYYRCVYLEEFLRVRRLRSFIRRGCRGFVRTVENAREIGESGLVLARLYGGVEFVF
jgi:hypothetical protein